MIKRSAQPLGSAKRGLCRRIVINTARGGLRNVARQEWMIDMKQHRQDLEEIALPWCQVVVDSLQPVVIDSEKALFYGLVTGDLRAS